MRNPQGHGIWVYPDAPAKECDTFTCAHCQFVVLVHAKEDPAKLGGFCFPCAKLICKDCVKTGRCEPFEKQIEKMEKRDRLLSAILGE